MTAMDHSPLIIVADGVRCVATHPETIVANPMITATACLLNIYDSFIFATWTNFPKKLSENQDHQASL